MWHKHHGGPNPYAGIDEQGQPLPQPMVRVGFIEIVPGGEEEQIIGFVRE